MNGPAARKGGRGQSLRAVRLGTGAPVRNLHGRIKLSGRIELAPGGERVTEWLGGLVERPTIYSRNGVSYAVARNWRADAREGQMRELKKAKASSCCATCGAAVDAVADLLAKLFGSLETSCVTAVPCGHSGRPDCLSRRLGEGVAARLGAPFVQCWADRYVSGVSHPKEFAKLPPLEWLNKPDRRTIVVDDVATSGWHLEEALTALRDAGVEAFGVAWIGGKRNAGSDRGEPEPDGSVFGRGRGSWSSGGKRRRQWGVSGG